VKCPEFSKEILRPTYTISLWLPKDEKIKYGWFSEGNCVSNNCNEIISLEECAAVAYLWSLNFYAGTWEPNASDGKPAPNGCYFRVSSSSVFWNNRETSQVATAEREKICWCQRKPTESPTTKLTNQYAIKPKPPDCGTLHMYPVDNSGDFLTYLNGDKLDYADLMLFNYVSTGVRFIPTRDMYVRAARLRAALAKGTKG